MPETTKIHVSMESYDLIKDFVAKKEKELGIKIPLVQATGMLLRLGYKESVGKAYSGKARKPKQYPR